VQNGTAELGGLTGRRTGEIERQRPPRPSKKAAARIAPAEEAAPSGAAEPAEVADEASKETSG
jgi:hypothetical protein